MLRHWAELSNFAYLEAPDKDAMKRVIAGTASFDAVYIDTPGFQRRSSLEKWMADMDMANLQAARHVTLSPFTELIQIQEFLKRYKSADPAGIVWTKLDEAVSYGNIVNIGQESSLPVSALSYGPELKESLAPATEALVWRLIFKRQLPGEAAGFSQQSQAAHRQGTESAGQIKRLGHGKTA